MTVPGSTECRRAGSTGSPSAEEFALAERAALVLAEDDPEAALDWWLSHWPDWVWTPVGESEECPIVIVSSGVLP